MNPIKMSYISQFIDATVLGLELDGSFYDRGRLSSDIIRISNRNLINRNFVRTKMKVLAEGYVDSLIQRGTIEHSCHAASHGFALTWQQFEESLDVPLAITIGNIFYNGKNIYGITLPKIREVVQEGCNTNRDIGVHVWLTTSDMSVIDLTALSTLTKLGFFDPPSPDNKVLVWNEELSSEFDYEPLLVDNNFFNRVEKGVVEYGA